MKTCAARMVSATSMTGQMQWHAGRLEYTDFQLNFVDFHFEGILLVLMISIAYHFTFHIPQKNKLWAYLVIIELNDKVFSGSSKSGEAIFCLVCTSTYSLCFCGERAKLFIYYHKKTSTFYRSSCMYLEFWMGKRLLKKK